MGQDRVNWCQLKQALKQRRFQENMTKTRQHCPFLESFLDRPKLEYSEAVRQGTSKESQWSSNASSDDSNSTLESLMKESAMSYSSGVALND